MYGEITGKIFLTVVIVILCVARVAMIFYARNRGENTSTSIVSVVLRIAIPILVAFLIWKMLWH